VRGFRRSWQPFPAYTRRVSSSVFRPAVLGVAAGFVSGMFGVGGGTLVVPGLALWIGLEMHRASATSLAAMVAFSSAAVLSFGIDGAVDWWAAALIVIGAGGGAVIGARLMGRIPERWLSGIFATVMLVAAARLALW